VLIQPKWQKERKLTKGIMERTKTHVEGRSRDDLYFDDDDDDDFITGLI
jgi:hypothetical protein